MVYFPQFPKQAFSRILQGFFPLMSYFLFLYSGLPPFNFCLTSLSLPLTFSLRDFLQEKVVCVLLLSKQDCFKAYHNVSKDLNINQQCACVYWIHRKRGFMTRKPNKVSFKFAAFLRNSRLYADSIGITSHPMQWIQLQGQIIISYVMKGI